MTGTYYYEKIGLACSLLVASMVFTMIPWLVHAKMKKKGFLVISFLTCLAAGVIVGAFFMHLLPELIMAHSHGHSEAGHHHHGHHDHHDHGSHHHHHNHSNDYDSEKIRSESCNSYQWGALAACLSFFLLLGLDRIFTSHQHGGQGCNASSSPKKDSPLACNDVSDLSVQATYPNVLDGSVPIIDDKEDVEGHRHRGSDDDCDSCHSSMIVGACHMDGLNQESSKSQAFLFVLVLSIHSFLEGLLAGPVNGKAEMIAFSICLGFHKLLESFALGVSVFKARFSMKLSLVLNGVYSILTPLAMILSVIVIEKDSMPSEVLLQVLTGLASGSFLFVGLMEMVAPEFHRKDKYTKWKFLVLMAGVGAISGLAALHSHHHH